ncbi:hypothetical protein, partial [Ralstonia pseudosolanacearum]|uniref:hypothetical protein n=1 Tax=Ralstonia pseudosolanacearum TaxID=1310165 RepID=UPI003AACC41A
KRIARLQSRVQSGSLQSPTSWRGMHAPGNFHASNWRCPPYPEREDLPFPIRCRADGMTSPEAPAGQCLQIVDR